MPKLRKNPIREERILNDFIVDAYGPEEEALGWCYYLENKIQFPFSARCLHARFGLGEDVLEPYKKTIDRWLWPTRFATRTRPSPKRSRLSPITKMQWATPRDSPNCWFSLRRTVL